MRLIPLQAHARGTYFAFSYAAPARIRTPSDTLIWYVSILVSRARTVESNRNWHMSVDFQMQHAAGNVVQPHP